MAFENFISVDETESCDKLNLIETTGSYDVDENPTGYGTPNIASSAIVSVILTVLAYGQTTGYIFTFTVASNVITACTVTAPNGTVTDIFDDLEFTTFPFTEAEPFVLNSSWIGYAEEAAITSGVINFEYEISDGTEDNTFTASTDELITCSTCCCVRVMEASLDAGNAECDCQSEKLDKARKARVFLDSAIWAIEELGDVDKAQRNIVYAQQLCEGKCKSC